MMARDRAVRPSRGKFLARFADDQSSAANVAISKIGMVRRLL